MGAVFKAAFVTETKMASPDLRLLRVNIPVKTGMFTYKGKL